MQGANPCLGIFIKKGQIMDQNNLTHPDILSCERTGHTQRELDDAADLEMEKLLAEEEDEEDGIWAGTQR